MATGMTATATLITACLPFSVDGLRRNRIARGSHHPKIASTKSVHTTPIRSRTGQVA
jgi:hypothetical protein